jgi:hypothetical protein
LQFFGVLSVKNSNTGARKLGTVEEAGVSVSLENSRILRPEECGDYAQGGEVACRKKEGLLG